MQEARELLPHSGEMVLIDKVTSHDETRVVATTTIREGCPFFRSGQEPMMGGISGVPSWVGLEYMAQTVAAWSGLHAKAQGEQPKSGFLIGSKSFRSNHTVFPLGSELTIQAKLQDQHGSLRVFECQIDSQDIEVHAILSIYEGEPPS